MIGGGAAVVGSAVYAVGEYVGHSKGKKEGVAEQVARDEKKVKDMHQNIISAGMKKDRIMKICYLKQKINYNYGIQTTNKERIARRSCWND